jgi:hypothetical protein
MVNKIICKRFFMMLSERVTKSGALILKMISHDGNVTELEPHIMRTVLDLRKSLE